MGRSREKSVTVEVSTSSSSYKPLAKRSAQLLLSPYCWSARKLCEFLRDCWDLVKEEKGQELKPEIKEFRDDLNSRAIECELWAPFEHWTDFISDDEFNALMRRNEGTPKPKIDKVDRLLQLIRNKVNHPENDSPYPTTLNWEPRDAGRIDWNRFADYWISKFVLLVPFVWSQFICMKTSLTKYYPSDLLDFKTDWRKLLFGPEEFVNELHAEFQKHLNSGFSHDRFELATGMSSHTVELRTLPGEEENLLNAVLSGDLFKKIVLSKSFITSQRNGNEKEVFSYKIGSEVDEKKCLTYIFLSLDHKLNGKLYTDLFEGSNEKIIIFTGECAIQSLASKIKEYENAKNFPISWGDLSMQKRKSLKKNGQFEIQGKLFGINEIVPGGGDDLLSHLEGKELNAFLINKRISILQKYRLPEVDRFYQERELYDPAILSCNCLTEEVMKKKDMYILVHDNPDISISCVLPKRKVFPKLKLNKLSGRIYYVKSKIEEVINDIRNFEGCENGMQINVHFLCSVIGVPNCFRWIATHGSSDGVRKSIENDSKSERRLPESYFLHMVDDGFVKNEIIFIANQCGMGKTQFLMNIANKLANERKHIIPLYIFMTDFVEVLRVHLEEHADLTCDDIMSALSSFLCLSIFENEFLSRLLKSHEESIPHSTPKLSMIFDGVDEVQSEMKELALKTLEILHKKFPELRIIAAVRDDAFEKLKLRFGTLGCMLAPIANPVSFIELYYRERFKVKVGSPKLKNNQKFKKTLRSIASPNLLIPEDKLFDTVNSLDPKPCLIVIYDNQDLGYSPLLMNLENNLKKNEKAKVLVYSSKRLANLLMKIAEPRRTLAFCDEIKNMECLLIDGKLWEAENQHLIKLALKAMVKIAVTLGKTIWLCLKNNMVEDVRRFGVNTLELEMLPMSKTEDELYMESFWRENLIGISHGNFFSEMMEMLATACVETGLGTKSKLSGIPLQCRMAAEILEEAFFALDFSLPEAKNSLCENYMTLMRRKYEIWFQKNYANVPVGSLLFKGFREQFNRFLQYLSLKQIFSEEIANKFRNELLVQKLEKCEELYDAAITQGILQSKDPLRFTHVSFAEYFVADFLYKTGKKDISVDSNFREKLENIETQEFHLNLALKRHVENYISVYSEISDDHSAIVCFLDKRQHPILNGKEFSKYRTQIMDRFISRLMDHSTLLLPQDGRMIPAEVNLLISVYTFELLTVQLILFHSPKHLIGYLIIALVNLDFEIADQFVKMLELRPEHLYEKLSQSESKYGFLHWVILGICCAKRVNLVGSFNKVKKKILEYSTHSTNIRKNLINQINSEGQTPLLFLMDCMNWYKAPFDMKLYEFLVTEFGADVDALDNHGNSVLHFSFYDNKHQGVERFPSNFFTEVFPNVIKFFLPRVKEKHSMNKLGLTPAVNFMLSLDQIRGCLLARDGVNNYLRCMKLFEYKEDFYERDEAGNTSINKLIEYLCLKSKRTHYTEIVTDAIVDQLNNIFAPELQIDFGTVNNEGRGAIDFGFENESVLVLKFLEIRAPNLFTAVQNKRFKILQKQISQRPKIKMVTKFTIL